MSFSKISAVFVAATLLSAPVAFAQVTGGTEGSAATGTTMTGPGTKAGNTMSNGAMKAGAPMTSGKSVSEPATASEVGAGTVGTKAGAAAGIQ